MIAWGLAIFFAAFALAVIMANAMSRAEAKPEPDIGYTDEYDPPIEDRALSRAILTTIKEDA